MRTNQECSQEKRSTRSWLSHVVWAIVARASVCSVQRALSDLALHFEWYIYERIWKIDRYHHYHYEEHQLRFILPDAETETEIEHRITDLLLHIKGKNQNYGKNKKKRIICTQSHSVHHIRKKSKSENTTGGKWRWHFFFFVIQFIYIMYRRNNSTKLSANEQASIVFTSRVDDCFCWYSKLW